VDGDRFVKSGTWDSINVVEAIQQGDGKGSATTYKLTTTVLLYMAIGKEELGETVLAGSLTRQVFYFVTHY
jgi:hypothetical protein